jgi:hypothetical protein
LKKISAADCDFVMRNALTPNETLRSSLETFKNDLGVSKLPYSIAHVRLGDEYIKSFSDSISLENEQLFKKIFIYLGCLSRDSNYLISTDSDDLSRYLSKVGLGVLPGKITHFGMENPNPVAVRDTLLQFLTIREAQQITQISAYGWGSGFSQTAAILGRVAIEKINLLDIL